MARWTRRRRRNNGLWFPTFQPQSPTVLTVPSNFTPVADVSNIIVGDEPFNQTTSTSYAIAGGLTLGLGTDFVTNRIVGKIHIGVEQDQNSSVAAVLVKAGIFVDRTDESGGLTNLAAWGILEEHSTQKRWLWRKSWLFSNQDCSVATAPVYPPSTGFYGSIADGGNVDVKVKARVSYEERLWLIVECIAQWTNGGEVPVNVHSLTDFRVLARRVARNNR